jgi:membrane fusion protein (multidrug efflux system)
MLTVLSDRGSDWIVTDGLKEGDRLIVAGFQKIAAGATVDPQERQAAQN